jgi:hypothetical protein
MNALFSSLSVIEGNHRRMSAPTFKSKFMEKNMYNALEFV